MSKQRPKNAWPDNWSKTYSGNFFFYIYTSISVNIHCALKMTKVKFNTSLIGMLIFKASYFI